MNITEKYTNLVEELLERATDQIGSSEGKMVIELLELLGRPNSWAAIDRAIEWAASGRNSLPCGGQATDHPSALG